MNMNLPESFSGNGPTHPKNLLSKSWSNCKAVSRIPCLGQPVFMRVTLIIAV